MRGEAEKRGGALSDSDLLHLWPGILHNFYVVLHFTVPGAIALGRNPRQDRISLPETQF